MYLLLALVSIIVIALVALGVALFLVHRRDGRGDADERPSPSVASAERDA